MYWKQTHYFFKLSNAYSLTLSKLTFSLIISWLLTVDWLFIILLEFFDTLILFALTFGGETFSLSPYLSLYLVSLYLCSMVGSLKMIFLRFDGLLIFCGACYEICSLFSYVITLKSILLILARWLMGFISELDYAQPMGF